jgi:hypothetical protein
MKDNRFAPFSPEVINAIHYDINGNVTTNLSLYKNYTLSKIIAIGCITASIFFMLGYVIPFTFNLLTIFFKSI